MQKLEEKDILKIVDEKGTVNTLEVAQSSGMDHQAVVGLIKSLEVSQMLSVEDKPREKDSWVLTTEGEQYAKDGTLEYRIFLDVTGDGVPKADLEKKYGKEFQFGFQYCMKRKWLSFDKASGKVLKVATEVSDTDGNLLVSVKQGKEIGDEDYKNLQKRKLLEKKVVKYFIASKGPKFSLEIVEEHADISADMLKRADFDTLVFKPFNLKSLGKEGHSGSLHPLMKVRSAFREILLELGYFPLTQLRRDAHQQLC